MKKLETSADAQRRGHSNGMRHIGLSFKFETHCRKIRWLGSFWNLSGNLQATISVWGVENPQACDYMHSMRNEPQFYVMWKFLLARALLSCNFAKTAKFCVENFVNFRRPLCVWKDN